MQLKLKKSLPRPELEAFGELRVRISRCVLTGTLLSYAWKYLVLK